MARDFVHFPDIYINLGLLTLHAPEAGHFGELIML